MKKYLLFSFCFINYLSFFSQEDCFKRLEDAFNKRGAYQISDEMHRNVIISFFDENGSNCVKGKVRVENGTIVTVFLQYKDDSFELLDKKFYNSKKMPPLIINGISEMIITADGEKLRVIFIDKLKPKNKTLKESELLENL
ncbi:MAG: hypothetical protein V4622_11960 [Bacteroidota bacterium]